MSQSILINDFGGYPFPFELSIALADRGYQIHHCYCASLSTTPQAALVSTNAKCQVVPVTLTHPLNKYSFLKRRSQEREYGRKVARLIRELKPDVVVSANTPLDSLANLVGGIKSVGGKHIIWWQDVLSVATERILRRKLGVVGAMVGKYYGHMERQLSRRADHIVMIAEKFRNIANQWQIPPEKTTVIPNWAPIRDIPIMSRDNAWANTRSLTSKFVFLYSGTLSLKHDPSLLCDLAKHTALHNAVVVVRSQGIGADWLRKQKEEQNIANLLIEPFGTYEETPLAFSAADVLVAVLEPEASEFSVPSKVLSYLCAQRPLLLSMPLDNAAAKLVIGAEAGLVASPNDRQEFLCNANKLIEDSSLKVRLGINARCMAEKLFDIDGISTKFIQIFDQLANNHKY